MVSDCDEIPKPSFVLAMKHCDGLSFPLSMQALHHYYSFSLMASNVDKVRNTTAQTEVSDLAAKDICSFLT